LDDARHLHVLIKFATPPDLDGRRLASCRITHKQSRHLHAFAL
jgi:hypothetical protein